MKSFINDHEQQKQDFLLFQYVEEKLSESRKREIEEKLTSDPSLQQELESWQATFFEEDFYDTTELENSLLMIPEKPWYFSGPFYASVLLLAISFFSFLPLNKKEADFIAKEPAPISLSVKKNVSSTHIGNNTPVYQAVTTFSTTSTKSGRIEPLSVRPQASRNKLPASTRENGPLVERPMPESISSLGLTTIKVSHGAAAEIVPQKVEIKPQNSLIISRKEQRRIRRMKEKNLQERKAREFMKGDRPYVVPLNTQNF